MKKLLSFLTKDIREFWTKNPVYTFELSKYGYQVVKELESNSGCRLYLAQSLKKPNNLVVIKQFQFARGRAWSDFETIETEIQVLKGLEHPGIPRYVDSLETDDGYCLVLEYKQAQPLSEARSFTPDEIEQITVSGLEILIYLQERSSPIIHGNIELQNVLVDDDLNVYLTDFGSAVTIRKNELTSNNSSLNPFDFNTQDLIKADLHGFGKVLTALQTNIKFAEHKHFRRCLEKLVAVNSNDRYCSAQEALRSFSNTSPICTIETILSMFMFISSQASLQIVLLLVLILMIFFS